MKAALALAILGSTSAVKLVDGPAFFNEPPHTETSPSAAGFVQLSACNSASIADVTCEIPNTQLFATGMNGDEDLGEDITMKGDKFHYVQKDHTEYPVNGGYNDSIDELDWANHHKTTLDSHHDNNKVDTLFPGAFMTAQVSSQ